MAPVIGKAARSVTRAKSTAGAARDAARAERQHQKLDDVANELGAPELARKRTSSRSSSSSPRKRSSSSSRPTSSRAGAVASRVVSEAGQQVNARGIAERAWDWVGAGVVLIVVLLVLQKADPMARVIGMARAQVQRFIYPPGVAPQPTPATRGVPRAVTPRAPQLEPVPATPQRRALQA